VAPAVAHCKGVREAAEQQVLLEQRVHIGQSVHIGGSCSTCCWCWGVKLRRHACYLEANRAHRSIVALCFCKNTRAR
jgi:hypothetical protein